MVAFLLHCYFHLLGQFVTIVLAVVVKQVEVWRLYLAPLTSFPDISGEEYQRLK